MGNGKFLVSRCVKERGLEEQFIGALAQAACPLSSSCLVDVIGTRLSASRRTWLIISYGSMLWT